MTPDEREAIERRATMEAQIKHMSEAIDSIKRTLDRLPETLVSRQQLEALERRLESVEHQLKEQSPTGLMEKVTKWAAGITAIGGAVALLWLVLERLNGRA